MIDTSSFERHNLISTDFSADQFYADMGSRLVKAGLHEVANQIFKIGLCRAFLRESLSRDQTSLINSIESLTVANEAALFQERVQQVEILESGEPMVDLKKIAKESDLPWTFTTTPYHSACGEWAGKERLFWTREKVTTSLIAIGSNLQSADFGLHFEDGFRPLGVQEGLFKRRYQMTKEANPDWGHDEIILETRSKTAYTPRFASHKAAAAVDVRVRDLRSSELIDIGHEYPDGGAIVALESPFVTQKQWENRMLLASLVLQNDMTMYPFEDWHVCAGDTTAAASESSNELPVAIYGPIKQFDASNGEIIEVYSHKELDEVFEVL
jgi:D-alanyl-D-alanine dipeptidase